MLELMALFGLMIVGALVIGVFGLIVGLFKLLFKVAMIPVWFAMALLKGVLVVVVAVVGVALFGPIVLVFGLAVLIPILLLGGMVWAGVALVT